MKMLKNFASSMKYINAGTVEFLVPADDQNTHYFLGNEHKNSG